VLLHDDHDYTPGFTRDFLLPFYDPLTRLAGTRRMHRLLLELAGIGPGRRVLDIGTGTGELALAIARSVPGVEVVGLDPDRLALRRAGRKAAARGLTGRVCFDHGYGDRLGYDDDSFDHVVSAFAYHHLESAAKDALLLGVARVLCPGGAFHLVDFGGHVDPGDGPVARLTLRSAMLGDNLDDALPERMRAAGLVRVEEVTHRVTRRLGRVTFWRAHAAGSP